MYKAAIKYLKTNFTLTFLFSSLLLFSYSFFQKNYVLDWSFILSKEYIYLTTLGLFFVAFLFFKYLFTTLVSRSILGNDTYFLIFFCASLMITGYTLVNYSMIMIGELISSIFYSLISTSLILIRIYFISKPSQNLPRTITLKTIYDNDISNIDFDFTVTLDALQNDDDHLYQFTDIVEKISTALINNNRLIVALEGTWGTGKSTVLNSIKKKVINKCLVIDDIDPWLFTNEESLFRAFINGLILKLKISQITNNIVNTYMSYYFSQIGIPFVNKILPKNELCQNDISIMINDYLTKNNIKVIILIDNIERMQPNNILFLYKMISTAFNFSNLSFILSYDYQVLHQSLTDIKIPPKMVDKIIDKKFQIYIPEDLLRHYTRVILENLIMRFSKSKDLSVLKLIDNDSIYVSTMRDLTNYVNSIDWLTFDTLYSKDYLTLLFIKLKNPVLYLWIRRNKNYLSLTNLYNYSFSNKETEIKTNDIGIPINEEEASLLYMLFNKKTDISFAEKNKLICSFSYFDLYFYKFSDFDYLSKSKYKNLFDSVISDKEEIVKIFDSLPDGLKNLLSLEIVSKLDKDYAILDSLKIINYYVEKLENNKISYEKSNNRNLMYHFISKILTKKFDISQDIISFMSDSMHLYFLNYTRDYFIDNGQKIHDTILTQFNTILIDRISSIVKDKVSILSSTAGKYSDDFAALLYPREDYFILKISELSEYVQSIINEYNVLDFLSYFVDYSQRNYFNLKFLQTIIDINHVKELVSRTSRNRELDAKELLIIKLLNTPEEPKMTLIY